MGVAAAGLAARAAVWEGLVENSPFGPPTGNAPAGNTTAEALELRGVFVDHGETFVSVYDNTSHAGRWVAVNEEGGAFVVRSFDAVKGVARVAYQGRELTLTLKQAKVVAAVAPAIPAGSVPVAPPANAGPGPAVVAGATPASEEAVRLAAIAEEIRRRRALRQQGMAVPPPGPNPKP